MHKDRRLHFLILSWCYLLSISTELPAQEFVLGGIARPDTKAPPKNARIQSKWGEQVDQWAIRIAPNAKSRWGSAESPTFSLQLKNESDKVRKFEIDETSLSLVVNGEVYHWNSPETKIVTLLKPGETRKNLFLIRLDPTQWKPDVVKKESQGSLPAFSEGKKKFEVRIVLDQDSNKIVKSGHVNFEVTQSAFEMPTVSGVLLSHDGKPIKGAQIYLCKDAQFSVYYSGFDGKWFKSKSVSHYDPFSGGFSSAIKPIPTGDKGEFDISPGIRDKRIVVLPPIGSAQVFDLPNSFDEWKVKLKETGSLVVEQDIEGESGNNNASLSSSRVLATGIFNGRTNMYLMTENFNIAMSNGKKYELKNIAPRQFWFARYKHVRIGKRSYSISRTNSLFEIEPGKETAFRMVRKTGQQITLSVTRVPQNMQYVVASVFDLNEPINLQNVYSNNTLWANAATDVDKSRMKFKSALISPGKYRVVAMSVPKGEKPNQYVYKPDYLGSKIVEVSESGELDVGEIRLYPVDTWIRNSGMALKLKLIDKSGNSIGSQSVWPIRKGYGQDFDGTVLQANAKGIAQSVRAAGKYRFASGLDDHRATVFEIQVPRMTEKTIIVADKPKWWDAKTKPNLEVTVSYNRDSKSVVFKIKNKGDATFSPSFGGIQFLMQSVAYNYSSAGVRFFPNENSTLYNLEIKPKETETFSVRLDKMQSEWLCTSGMIAGFKIQEQNKVLSEDRVWGGAIIGPVFSKPNAFPRLPTFEPKPFR